MSQMTSEKAEKYNIMPLQRYSDVSENNIYSPPRFENIESDGLREINDGTQHGWLASQHETENDSPLSISNPETTQEKQNLEIVKNLNNSKFAVKSDPSATPPPYTFKSNDGSCLNKSHPETSLKPQKSQVGAPPKPFYKSIIATTAALVLQNYWRDYLKRRRNTNTGIGWFTLLCNPIVVISV